MKTKILNLGCGNDTYGTDFLDIYPTRPEVIKHDLTKGRLPYKDNTFDEVFSKNLFEHLPDPSCSIYHLDRITSYNIILIALRLESEMTIDIISYSLLFT